MKEKINYSVKTNIKPIQFKTISKKFVIKRSRKDTSINKSRVPDAFTYFNLYVVGLQFFSFLLSIEVTQMLNKKTKGIIYLVCFLPFLIREI